MRPPALLLVACVVLAGCPKKDAASGDGGEASSSSGGGGILSFLSGTPFEGEIALQITDRKAGKPPMNMVYEVKSPKMRLDLPADVTKGAAKQGFGGKNVWMLVDPPQKKMWAVTDDEKKAILFDLDKMKDDMKKLGAGGGGAGPGKPSAPTKPPPKITKTGKMDKVCGYECENWEIEDEGKKTSVCAAKGITWFDLHSMGTIDAKTAVMAELTDANHFPLRVVSTENGVETERMEATRCEKKKMDDARFVVPAGYQVLDLGQMMQGLGGLGAPPGSGRPGYPGLPGPGRK